MPGTVGAVPLGRAERYLPVRDREPDLETLTGSRGSLLLDIR